MARDNWTPFPQDNDIRAGVSSDGSALRGANSSAEAKAAKKIGEILNTYTFNPPAFAYMLCSNSTLAPRIMAMVKAILSYYANRWDNGEMNDVTRDAARLRDALKKFD